MNDLEELANWWEKESQQIRNKAIQELGKRVILMLEMYQKQMKAQEERFFQREQKLFSRVDLWQTRMQTLEERVDLQIEAEVEGQKTAFSGEVDRMMEAQNKIFLETIGTMLQSSQEALREQKGGDTMPKV